MNRKVRSPMRVRVLGAPHIVTWTKQTWIKHQCTSRTPEDIQVGRFLSHYEIQQVQVKHILPDDIQHGPILEFEISVNWRKIPIKMPIPASTSSYNRTVG